MTGSVDDLVSRGRAALRVGDAATARDVLAPGDPSAPDILEARARAAYLDLQFRTAIDLWQAAYAAYRAAADNVAAVRVARTLGNTHGAILGDWAVANGWLARAQTLLGGDQESAEAGWVALSRGMFEPERTRKDRLFRLALDAGRRHGDSDLQFVALAYLGASLVHDDRTEEGMVLLDEALAAVAGDEVDDATSVEEVFCQLFSACEHAHDVTRADQWIAVGQAVAERRRLPAVSAFCRTHYGGILTAAGRWDEADAALSEAVRLWGLGWRSLRSGALVRLADLRVRQGRFEEAEQLLADPAVVADAASARPRAALHLARGRHAAARDVATHALAGTGSDSAAAAPLLSLLVDVHLAAGDLAEADRAVAALEDGARQHRTPYLAAVAALARARVVQASGTGDPTGFLRDALAGFVEARMPVEAALSRLELAQALASDQPESAMVEARAALDAFERLQAARHVDAACATLRSLGVRTAAPRAGHGPLTRREQEVLDLLALGLSNPEISARLFISRKTVEHHVGNILAKLGLRSRSEAAGYAVRSKQGTK